jgi:hypothetical protein
VVPSRLLENRCGHSRRFGPNLQTQEPVIWNETALSLSSAYVPTLMKCAFYSFSLQRLGGVFEVRIYPSEYSIPNIMAACKETPDAEYAWPSKVIHGIDFTKLEKVVGSIDYASVRKRRAIYSRLYHEASISHQQGRGISFTDMLLLLAHHKLIVDREALVFVSRLCIDNNLLTFLQLEGSCRPDGNQ